MAKRGSKAERNRLVSAAYAGRRETVQKLLRAGLDPNGRDEHGGQPLHRAVLGGHSEVVLDLLAAGADVNAVDEDGRTALFYASRLGRPPVEQALRAAGARRKTIRRDAPAATGPSQVRGRRLEDLQAAALREEHLPLSDRRGILTFEDDTSTVLVRAPVADVAGALVAGRTTARWRARLEAGDEVVVPERALFVAQLRGKSWSQLVPRRPSWPQLDERGLARALSRELGAPGIYYFNSDAAGAFGYEVFDADRSVERLDSDERGTRFRSEVTDEDPGEHAALFADAFFREQDVVIYGLRFAHLVGGVAVPSGARTSLPDVSEFERLDLVSEEPR